MSERRSWRRAPTVAERVCSRLDHSRVVAVLRRVISVTIAFVSASARRDCSDDAADVAAGV
jgi:hypothetical protein